jgi:hypothetical protein
MEKTETNNGKKGGLLKGKPHYDKDGKSLGGIKAIVVDTNKPVELEGGEVIINKEASKKYWKELSKINQSAGNGVPILPPNEFDEDPSEYKDGGNIIDFNPNHVPSKRNINYAKKIKDKYPKIWDLGGNIFGNEAFVNLERVSKRGYWLESEEWMYIKWRSYVARHQHDFRIEGVIAMLKWADIVNKGWAYMKDLIEAKIEKQGWKTNKTTRMKQGGVVKQDSLWKSIIDKFDKIYYRDGADDYELVSDQVKAEEYKWQFDKYSKYASTLSWADAEKMFKKSLTEDELKSIEISYKKDEYADLEEHDSEKYYVEIFVKLKKYANGGKVGDCIDYIQNSESIKNNGYYLHINNINNYVSSNSVNIPKINSLCLITFNSDNQKNLKAVDTIYSMSLASEIAKLLNIDIEMARIIVYEQTTQSKPFKMDMLDDIKNENIIVADRDKIVCTNLSIQYANGGEIEQYMEKGGNIPIIWKKNIGEEGWSSTMEGKNPYENLGGYISDSGNWIIYRSGRWFLDKWDNQEKFIRDGNWVVQFKGEFYGDLDSLTSAKNYVNDWIRAKPTEFKQGGEIEQYKEQGILDLNFYPTNSEHAKEYGLKAKNPLFIQNLTVKESDSLKNLDEYAINNGHDVIFGHIIQKAKFNDVEMIKNWLHNNGYAINQDNNDFHKILTDKQDSVTMDIPLLIRTLELAREDVKSDAELHHVVENLLKLKNKKVLTMDDYEYIANVKSKHISKMKEGGNVDEAEKPNFETHLNTYLNNNGIKFEHHDAEVEIYNQELEINKLLS